MISTIFDIDSDDDDGDENDGDYYYDYHHYHKDFLFIFKTLALTKKYQQIYYFIFKAKIQQA